MGWIDENLRREHLLEYTVEAGNPDKHNIRKFKGHKRATHYRFPTIRRACAEDTGSIGRKHTEEEIKRPYALARETGFDNINYGYYRRTRNIFLKWKTTLGGRGAQIAQ